MTLSPRWRLKLARFREGLASAFRPTRKEARPRLCPSCGTLVGSTATKCHQCGASLTFSLAAASRTLEGLFGVASPATTFILGFDIVLYLLSLMITIRAGGGFSMGGGLMGLLNLGAIPSGVLVRLGASAPFFMIVHQPWRFVTAVFLHGSLLHIAFNMWFLVDMGPAIEELYGSARYLFIFVTTGAFGFLVSSYTGHLSIGASGALMGLVGVLLGMTSGRRTAAMQMLRDQMIKIVIYIAVIGFLLPGIDNWAHGGGLLSGYLLGRMMQDRPPANAAERKRAYALGWSAGAVLVASFGWMLANFFRGT